MVEKIITAKEFAYEILNNDKYKIYKDAIHAYKSNPYHVLEIYEKIKELEKKFTKKQKQNYNHNLFINSTPQFFTVATQCVCSGFIYKSGLVNKYVKGIFSQEELRDINSELARKRISKKKSLDDVL